MNFYENMLYEIDNRVMGYEHKYVVLEALLVALDEMRISETQSEFEKKLDEFVFMFIDNTPEGRLHNGN